MFFTLFQILLDNLTVNILLIVNLFNSAVFSIFFLAEFIFFIFVFTFLINANTLLLNLIFQYSITQNTNIKQVLTNPITKFKLQYLISRLYIF